mmetsp:Transcript_30024/g.48156  ORF Transcript_30024/g.48156 Transcript_30024/m.48156 type:complete len:117 (+) Transcript_30024:838-1188(+)
MSNAPKCWQRVAVDRRSPAPEGSKAQVRSGRSFAATASAMSSCLSVKSKAGLGAAGGFSSFHLHALRVGVQIGDPGPDDLGRFEGVQSDELEHGDLRRLYGDDVREGGPLDGEGDL